MAQNIDQEPPDNFYIAFGTERRGIRVVAFKSGIIPEQDRSANLAWDEYTHLLGNPGDPENTERVQRIALAQELANRLVDKATGFSADQIYNKLLRLNRTLTGKHEAEIEFELE